MGILYKRNILCTTEGYANVLTVLLQGLQTRQNA